MTYEINKTMIEIQRWENLLQPKERRIWNEYDSDR